MDRSQRLKISVIISTRERPRFLQDCLNALLQSEREPHEVLVVDQSLGQDTGEIVRGLMQRYPGLLYLKDPGEGASRAKNLAIRSSQGELLAFTDDDCLVSPAWVLRASQEFERKEGLAALIGKVVKGHSLADLSNGLAGNRPRRRGLLETLRGSPQGDGDHPWEVVGKADPWRLGPSGGNFFIRRTVLEQVGLFDESLGPGSSFRSAEDADLVYRVLKAGGTIQYHPGVQIVHRIWRSEEEDMEKRYGYGLGVGAFLAKHLSLSDPFPLYLFFSRFSKKPLKLLLGLLLLCPEMRRDGYYWSRGILRGFWERGRGKPPW